MFLKFHVAAVLVPAFGLAIQQQTPSRRIVQGLFKVTAYLALMDCKTRAQTLVQGEFLGARTTTYFMAGYDVVVGGRLTRAAASALLSASFFDGTTTD